MPSLTTKFFVELWLLYIYCSTKFFVELWPVILFVFSKSCRAYWLVQFFQYFPSFVQPFAFLIFCWRYFEEPVTTLIVSVRLSFSCFLLFNWFSTFCLKFCLLQERSTLGATTTLNACRNYMNCSLTTLDFNNFIQFGNFLLLHSSFSFSTLLQIIFRDVSYDGLHTYDSASLCSIRIYFIEVITYSCW